MADGRTRLLSLDALPRALVVRELSVEVLEGPDRGKTFGPLAPPIRLGSARGNDVVLEDATVSRFHCTIDRAGDGLVVVDGGSTNGTFLGPYRVRDADLAEGAVLSLGETRLTVRSGGARPLEISPRSRFGALLGESPLMRALFAVLERLASADVPVLVEGETGAGKELVARALHTEGRRKDAPFVVVDCGAMAPTLVESELFGHVRGAFTGADSSRTGAFELAGDGTIFLDEIGELPSSLQPKLLRVLEGGTVKPLGTGREVSVAARVVAATHRDLRRMVNEGSFREDLYFRLAVCPLRVPPLRERREDVALLARHFLGRALGAPPPELSPETLAILQSHPWTGNVRELRNAVERAVLLGDPAAAARGDLADMLRVAHPRERRHTDGPLPLEEAKRRFERDYLVKLLARHGEDLRKAAEEAGVHPKSLERLLRRHDIARRQP